MHRLITYNVLGGLGVISAYIYLMILESKRNEDDEINKGKSVIGKYSKSRLYLEINKNTDQGMFEKYATSRLWLDIDKDTAKSLIPLQIIAGVCFVVVTIYILNSARDIHWPTKGIYSYRGGVDAIYLFFYVGAILWPLMTPIYLNSPGTGYCLLVSFSLVLSAIGSILLIAGAFEADGVPVWFVYSTLIFGSVVILADGVGWNARMIYQHVHRFNSNTSNMAPMDMSKSGITYIIV